MKYEEITTAGPEGRLAGTLTFSGQNESIEDHTPILVIVPGSGPTDRDGNSPLGISTNTYRLLSEALAAKGVPSVRIDKRGMFGSKDATPDANDVTIEAYGDDLLAWIDTERVRFPRSDGKLRRVVPVGHSEGGLVVLSAAARILNPYKMVLIACPGRPLAEVLREQLRANAANAEIVSAAESAISSLENGKRVDTNDLHPALASLFSDAVQPLLIDLFQYDPVELMRSINFPILIVQGDRDLQVTVEDSVTLSHGSETAVSAILPEVNHLLKRVHENSRDANVMTYSDASLPIAEIAIETICEFLSLQ